MDTGAGPPLEGKRLDAQGEPVQRVRAELVEGHAAGALDETKADGAHARVEFDDGRSVRNCGVDGGDAVADRLTRFYEKVLDCYNFKQN